MLPKVYDRRGILQTRQWVYDHYGFLTVVPPAGRPLNGPRYALAALREVNGPILTATVLTANAQPIAQVRVMLSWPDAPEAPAAGWLERAAGANTSREGFARHHLGPGADYDPPAIGPHALWIFGPNVSPMITGLGIVNGYLLEPTFRLLGQHEPANPPPVDEALHLLRSASGHMGTAIDDVAAAIDRLQSLPSPEPPHDLHS
jgi:hypothetical protein